MSAAPRVPHFYGLQNLSVLPHGLLAPDPGVQLHAHVTAGDGHDADLLPVHGGAVPQ